jgi:hypothetical protein
MSDETKDKHTPGPWTIVGAPDSKGNLWIDSAKTVVATVQDNYHNKPELVAANAKLIAAAPAMLAALEAIHAVLNQPVQFSGERTSTDVLRLDAGYAREVAMAAIAQARGEA